MRVFDDVVGGAVGDGHSGQCGVEAGARDEGAGVADEEVLDVVGLAIGIDNGGLGVVAHAAGAHGVGAVVQADAHLVSAGGLHHLGGLVSGGGGELDVVVAP